MKDLTIAIIIARGGSVRLPRKNVKPFCGLPMVAWTIIQTTCSHLIDAVYVSTDDDEIESVAKRFGANVIRRPLWPNPNLVSGAMPTVHAITLLKAIYGDRFKTVVSILPTNPLNKPEDFDTGIALFNKLGCDAIGPAINDREVVLWKKTSSSKARMTIFDKKYGYLTQGPGWTVTSPEALLTTYESMPEGLLDADLDKMENWPALERNFFPVEVWQYADCDTAKEFELGEVLMKHYILKEDGPAVYYGYADQEKLLISGLPTIRCDLEEYNPDNLVTEETINNAIKLYGDDLIKQGVN